MTVPPTSKVDARGGRRHHRPCRFDQAKGAGSAAATASRSRGPKLSSKLQSSLNQYVRANGAVNVATGVPIASAVPGIVGKEPKLSPKLQASLNQYVRAHGAVDLGTGARSRPEAPEPEGNAGQLAAAVAVRRMTV